MLKKWILLLCIGLASCSRVDVHTYSQETPTLELRQFFEGRTEAWGMFQKRSGEVVKRFHVEINGTGTFRPLTPVVYLRIERGREQCTALHAALARHGLVSASPFDYHPHVTLAHGTDDAALDRAQEMLRTYRAGFLVDRVHLYEGDAQGHWHPRQSLALGARTANEHGAH